MKEQLKTWWESITVREQKLTMLSIVMVAIAVLYWGVWAPLAGQLRDNKEQLIRAESMLSWTKEKSTMLLQSGLTVQQATTGNLTQILNNSASQYNITFSRSVNRNEGIEVRITEVEFDSLLRWLTKLSNQYGVAVLNVDLTKAKREGYVKVNRLLLGS